MTLCCLTDIVLYQKIHYAIWCLLGYIIVILYYTAKGAKVYSTRTKVGLPYMLIYLLPCSCSYNLSSFWFILKQQWTIEEIYIFCNSSHLEWRAGLSDPILKGTHPKTIPARFGVIWFSSFRGEDLNVIFNQNMPNLHNRYKSAERKNSQKNPEYMLNFSLPCSCS